MAARFIKGTLEISVVPSVSDPGLESMTIVVTPEGFTDEGGLGRSGDATSLVSVEHIADRIKALFDGAALGAILDHLAQLRAAL